MNPVAIVETAANMKKPSDINPNNPMQIGMSKAIVFNVFNVVLIILFIFKLSEKIESFD